MRLGQPRRGRAPVINVTSLIDVLFLLVIFVLVASKFEPEAGVAVDLPQAAASPARARPASYDLVITHDGTLYLQKDRIAEEDLALRVRSLRGEMDDPVLVLHVDRAAPSGVTVRVLGILRSAGQAKLDFRTKP